MEKELWALKNKITKEIAISGLSSKSNSVPFLFGSREDARDSKEEDEKVIKIKVKYKEIK